MEITDRTPALYEDDPAPPPEYQHPDELSGSARKMVDDYIAAGGQYPEALARAILTPHDPCACPYGPDVCDECDDALDYDYYQVQYGAAAA